MLQITQLTSKEYTISCQEQQQICGGYNRTAEELWSGYSTGEYDITLTDEHTSYKGNLVVFWGEDSESGDREVDGIVNLDTGERARRNNIDNSQGSRIKFGLS